MSVIDLRHFQAQAEAMVDGYGHRALLLQLSNKGYKGVEPDNINLHDAYEEAPTAVQLVILTICGENRGKVCSNCAQPCLIAEGKGIDHLCSHVQRHAKATIAHAMNGVPAQL